MAKPPRPTPLPLLAKINQIIVDLAALADTIEANRATELFRHKRMQNHADGKFHTGANHAEFVLIGDAPADLGENVIPFPLRNPRR